MTKFETLPPNIRALILVKLAAELSAHHCDSLDDLAKKQHIDVMSAWQRICRHARQAPCTIPLDAQPR